MKLGANTKWENEIKMAGSGRFNSGSSEELQTVVQSRGCISISPFCQKYQSEPSSIRIRPELSLTNSVRVCSYI